MSQYEWVGLGSAQRTARAGVEGRRRAVETSREGVAEPSISPAAHELPMSDFRGAMGAAGVPLLNLVPALISDSPSTRPSTHSRFGPAITFGVSPAAAVCWPRTRARCEQDGSKEGRRRARQPGRHRPPTAGPFSSMPGPRAPCSTLLSQAASGIAAEQLMALQPARRPQQQRHICPQPPPLPGRPPLRQPPLLPPATLSPLTYLPACPAEGQGQAG